MTEFWTAFCSSFWNMFIASLMLSLALTGIILILDGLYIKYKVRKMLLQEQALKSTGRR